jgi:guanylate kinase
MSRRRLENANQPSAPIHIKKSGLLFIVSAPSGAGKSTLCHAVLDHFADLLYSISYTTRKPRSDEQEGVDYHFITQKDFEAGIAKNRWAEWALVHGNYYGTSAEFLDQGLSAGRDILLDIDVQGARQILQRHPNGVTIFIMPPSLEALRHRLESRGSDSADDIIVRLDNAEKEMAQRDLYRHVVVNDRLPDAAAKLIGIFERYRYNRDLQAQGSIYE